MQSVTIFWDTENEDDEDVVRMLRTLPHWDWSAPTYFRVSPTAIYNKVYIFFELVSYLVGIIFLNFDGCTKKDHDFSRFLYLYVSIILN